MILKHEQHKTENDVPPHLCFFSHSDEEPEKPINISPGVTIWLTVNPTTVFEGKHLVIDEPCPFIIEKLLVGGKSLFPSWANVQINATMFARNSKAEDLTWFDAGPEKPITLLVKNNSMMSAMFLARLYGTFKEQTA